MHVAGTIDRYYHQGSRCDRKAWGREEEACRCTSDVGLVPDPAPGASGRIWREEKLRVRGLAIIWNILVPDVCPHLVDRHYKSAKRRHSFEDISQSRGNVVRDNASDIAPCLVCASLRLRVCVCMCVSASLSDNKKEMQVTLRIGGFANDLCTGDIIEQENDETS